MKGLPQMLFLPMMQRLLLCTILLVLAGCMTKRLSLPPEHPGIAKQYSFLVKKVVYDPHGRPLFTERLTDRPTAPGKTFTVVHAIDGLPSRSYDIVVTELPDTGPGPLAVIYEWTGRGFEGGIEITSGISPDGVVISSGAEAAAYLAVKTAPVVIGTVTGFVVGVVASIPETARELRRILVSARETMTGYTEYSYDKENRLRYMKLYPPDEHADPLVRTEFFYAGAGEVPVRAVVTSTTDGTVRQIP